MDFGPNLMRHLRGKRRCGHLELDVGLERDM